MGEIIAITSGKGGVGRTTFTANLGAALSDLGKRVLLVDGAIGSGDLDLALGLQDQVVYHLVDVVEGNCKILEALIRDKEEQALYLLPSSRTRDSSSVSADQFSKLMKIFRREFDYVLIDTEAGSGKGFREAASASDRIFVLTTPDRFSVRGASELADAIPEEKAENAYLIINRLRLDLIREKEVQGPEEIVRSTGLPLFGITMESDDVLLMTESGRPVTDLSGSACRSFVNVARRILGESIPIDLRSRK